jgi:alkanesulfonate monooxygenase SsuD/methylene tetrahydromethanopterin reductase-like flavin-dependent oxidoreductase (luciferase family)
VEGHFLQADTASELRERALKATTAGAAAVVLSQGALGDPIVMAAGLALVLPESWLGARLDLTEDRRHPAMIARDMTSLDLVTQGRSMLCFGPPFSDELAEAMALCRALWAEGAVTSEGPRFPARAPATRARPLGASSPLIALDLTTGETVPSSVSALADLFVYPTSAPTVCEMVRV